MHTKTAIDNLCRAIFRIKIFGREAEINRFFKEHLTCYTLYREFVDRTVQFNQAFQDLHKTTRGLNDVDWVTQSFKSNGEMLGTGQELGYSNFPSIMPNMVHLKSISMKITNVTQLIGSALSSPSFISEAGYRRPVLIFGGLLHFLLMIIFFFFFFFTISQIVV